MTPGPGTETDALTDASITASGGESEGTALSVGSYWFPAVVYEITLAPRPASPGTNVPSRNRSAPLDLSTATRGGHQSQHYRHRRHSPTRPRRSSVADALEVAADGLLLLPVGGPLGDRLALVPRLLALGEGDLDLRPAVVEVQREGNDGQALLRHLPVELGDLVAVQQQLALAPRGVVGPGALGVLGDVHRVEPGLAALDVHEAVDEGRATLAQRLHLGAREHQAGLVGVLDVVVVARLLVLRDELAPLFLRHPTIVAR